MSWKDFVPLGIMFLGLVLFLHGANYYDAIVGWSGVFLAVGGLLAEIGLKIFEFLTKKGD